MKKKDIDTLLRHMLRKVGSKPSLSETKQKTAKALLYKLRAELLHAVQEAAQELYAGKPQDVKKLEKLIQDIGRIQ